MVCLLDVKEHNSVICILGQMWLLGYSYGKAHSVYDRGLALFRMSHLTFSSFGLSIKLL
jgi:hypothetical protein